MFDGGGPGGVEGVFYVAVDASDGGYAECADVSEERGGVFRADVLRVYEESEAREVGLVVLHSLWRG